MCAVPPYVQRVAAGWVRCANAANGLRSPGSDVRGRYRARASLQVARPWSAQARVPRPETR